MCQSECLLKKISVVNALKLNLDQLKLIFLCRSSSIMELTTAVMDPTTISGEGKGLDIGSVLA